MTLFFNKLVKINNPLRIFFLCGSSFSSKEKKVDFNGHTLEIKDKRLVFQNYIEVKYPNKNYRTIILEDKFMFGNRSKKHLNYNDINLKSLKSIELLTSLFSDRVFILHESFSTAAEIGMFSTSEDINNKLVILTPSSFSVEEEYVSGFMRLAYRNRFYKDHNIKVIEYTPGIYSFSVSQDVKKLHTFFVGNEITGALERKLEDNLSDQNEKKINFGKKSSIVNLKNNYYTLTGNEIKIVLDSNDLLSYLISLFNINSFKREFIKSVDISDLKNDNPINRRKKAFNYTSEKLVGILKQVFYNTLKTEIPDIEKKIGSIDNVHSSLKLSVNHKIVDFKECISYFLYILCALSYISYVNNETRFSISDDFKPVYWEYKDLVNESKNTKDIWSR